MQCIKCNCLLVGKQLFCIECGERVLIECSQCHSFWEPISKFCEACGCKLEVGDDSQSAKAVFASSREEWKHVSILFADIKGSTSLIEKLDPEEAHQLLKPVIHAMVDAIHQYKGIVIHTAGDGISALFGAPKALEDHALWACCAALAIKEKTNGIPNILIRVGLNSGTVLLDVMKRGEHHEYEVLGLAVNLAASLEQTAAPGHIHLSQATLDLVNPYVEVQSLEAVHLKGFDEPVNTYDLVKMKKNITFE